MTRFVEIDGLTINPDQIVELADDSAYYPDMPTTIYLSDARGFRSSLTVSELVALIDPPVVPYHQTPVGWDDSPEPEAPAVDPNQPALDFSAVPSEVSLGEPSLAEAWRARKGRK